jgi:tRNA dimethylallyltransferase
MAALKHLIVIAGPTAIGKTETAIQLAKHFRTAIISADSRQCYQEMSIGTAKPTQEELDAVPHYFINSHSIHQNLSAADYEQLALSYCNEIFTQHDVAILCGGTGLYIKALCEGLDEMPPVDKLVAEKVMQSYQEHGMQWLVDAVRTEDPAFFSVAEQQNPARLLRALIFVRSHQQSIIHFRSGKVKGRPFNIIKVGLEIPREELYRRINLRVDKMVTQGLIEEVVALYPYRHLKNLQTVGYSEFWAIDQFPPSGADLNRVIDLIKQHTRNYAKRQCTWFKKDAQFKWFDPSDLKGILKYIDELMARISRV